MFYILLAGSLYCIKMFFTYTNETQKIVFYEKPHDTATPEHIQQLIKIHEN